MEDDDRSELDAMLGSLSADAARIASDAMDGVIEHGAAGQAPANASLDRIARAVTDALAHASRRRALSANQIATAVARAVQRGARFT